jgi:DNA-binding CsgD family transcriptional regulator
MTSFLKVFFQKLLNDLRLTRPAARPRRYSLDEEAAGLLRLIAEKEQRAEEEVAGELLDIAIRQRMHAEKHLHLWKSLTRRERQAVALACLGHTNAVIAQRMGIAEQTVKSHLHSAERKFGVSSKNQLLRMLSDWDFSGWEQNFFS